MKKHDLTNIDIMRRKDRQVTDEAWIVDYITKADFGTLATVSEDQPFLTMTVFVYDKKTHAIYLHTSKHGRLFANIEKNKKVCFSIGKIGRLLPADSAREFSNEYNSLIAFGRCEVMTDMKDAKEKMYLLLSKYFPHLKKDDDFKAISQPEIEEIAVFKIAIESWTAKQKIAEQNFPGAMSFSDVLKFNK